jgi:hypothetical protein
MAVILSMELGYPTTTLVHRSVEAVDYEERSRWTRPSGNVVSLIPPRDPDHGGSAA